MDSCVIGYRLRAESRQRERPARGRRVNRFIPGCSTRPQWVVEPPSVPASAAEDEITTDEVQASHAVLLR